MHETINQRSRLASKIADRLEQTLNDKNEGLQKVKKRETIQLKNSSHAVSPLATHETPMNCEDS